MCNYIKFDPKHQDFGRISSLDGVYIIALREGCNIPQSAIKPSYRLHDGLKVLYVGKTNQGLNSRIGKTHFNGTAGRSTLRKSLGCLFGYKLIPRSKNNPNDGKTTFETCDEERLSKWMRDNLIVFYATAINDIKSVENELIHSYSPPLNLQQVPLDDNKEFRAYLTSLRGNR